MEYQTCVDSWCNRKWHMTIMSIRHMIYAIYSSLYHANGEKYIYIPYRLLLIDDARYSHSWSIFISCWRPETVWTTCNLNVLLMHLSIHGSYIYIYGRLVCRIFPLWFLSPVSDAKCLQNVFISICRLHQKLSFSSLVPLANKVLLCPVITG